MSGKMKVSPDVNYYWNKYSDGARIGKKGLKALLEEVLEWKDSADKNYISAVKGRSEFRKALREFRSRSSP